MKQLRSIAVASLLALGSASALLAQDATPAPGDTVTVPLNSGTVPGAPAPIATQVVIDVDEPLPAEITLPPNGVLVLVRKETFVGTDVVATQTNLDKGDEPLMRRIYFIREPDPPAGYRFVGQYAVDRLGEGGLVITHTVVSPGAIPTSKTVKVIVH